MQAAGSTLQLLIPVYARAVEQRDAYKWRRLHVYLARAVEQRLQWARWGFHSGDCSSNIGRFWTQVYSEGKELLRRMLLDLEFCILDLLQRMLLDINFLHLECVIVSFCWSPGYSSIFVGRQGTLPKWNADRSKWVLLSCSAGPGHVLVGRKQTCTNCMKTVQKCLGLQSSLWLLLYSALVNDVEVGCVAVCLLARCLQIRFGPAAFGCMMRSVCWWEIFYPVSTICVGGKRTYPNGMPTVQNAAHAVPPAFMVCLNKRFEYAT